MRRHQLGSILVSSFCYNSIGVHIIKLRLSHERIIIKVTRLIITLKIYLFDGCTIHIDFSERIYSPKFETAGMSLGVDGDLNIFCY